jgi:hypothetical protein
MKHKPLFGIDLPQPEYDLLATKEIYGVLLDKELTLFTTKWFDYRAYHPVKATYLFVHHFLIAYKRMTARIVDVELALYVKPFKGSDFMVSSDKTAFWKARQAADSMGIPYNLYISYIMNARFDMGIPFVPRITMFYSDWAMEKAIEGWMSTAEHTITPAITQLRRDVDVEYQHYLCSLINLRADPLYALADWLFNKRTLTKKIALHYFSQHQIDLAYNLNNYLMD